LKQDYLLLKSNWLVGAEFSLGEQLTDFTNETKRQTSAPLTPFLRNQAFDPERRDQVGCRKDHQLKNPTALHLATIKEFETDPQ
jgi:hypothetical protein